MKSLIAFCAILGSALSQKYLNQCRAYQYESKRCDSFTFDDVKCFPWRTTHCKPEISYSGQCTMYICPVKS